MTDWRAEASRVIKAFDDALGRPPFPVNAPDDLVSKAQAVQGTLGTVAAAGKLESLEGVSEVTTTLPILCASLKEGTPNHTPCLRLYRPLLLAAAHASSLSTYPISYLLRDAEQVLAPQEVPSLSGSSVACTLARASTAASREVDGDDAEVEKEVTLFTFMALTHSLTPAYMRRFLRLGALEPPAAGNAANSKPGKGKGGASHAGDTDKKAHPSSPSTTASGANRAGEVGGGYSAVPCALLHSMIEAPLSEECRAVFESFVDNTAKFLACVAGDGELARRILDVYAGHLVPKLKPSSLLPCLDAPLLDYFVDVVAASQRAGHTTLLSSRELRDVALRAWDAARLRRLGCAAVSRSIGTEDATASLLVYVFLYLIYCDLGSDETPTTPPPSQPDTAATEPRLSVTESHLIAAVCKASKAVFLADRAPASCASVSSAYVQSELGVLLVEGSALPMALAPLQVFGDLLLARPAAVALWRRGLVRQLEWGTEDATLMMATATASASLVEASVVSVLEGVLRGVPRSDQGVRPSTKHEQESAKGGAAKSKRKQKSAAGRSGKGSRIDAASSSPNGGLPSAAAAAVPAPVPLSELLSGCCTCLLLTALLRAGAEASRGEGGSSVDSVCYQDGHVLDCVVRAYSYLLQHQSQRLSAALWHKFSIFTCFMWQWAMTALCRDTEGGGMTYLASMRTLLSAPSTIAVLTALTEDTGSMLWLSPLLLPSYFFLPSTSNAAAEMLSQVLWGSPCRALWIAVVRAAASGEIVGGGGKTAGQAAKTTSSLLTQQLHPIPPAFLLGLLCSQWSDPIVADVAECVAATTVGAGDGTALVASLIRMRTSSACAGDVALPPTCGLAFERAPASASQHGLQRLLDEVERLQEKYLTAAKSARQEAHEEDHQRMQEQLQSVRALADAHRAFCNTAEAKRAARTAEQQHVQEELQRRRAAHVARLRDDAAALERKRQVALETLRRKAMQSRVDAEAARQRRFDSYRRRLESEYRVSTFLEHLQLSSARVMEVREALRTVMDSITPDDLLEYLVSGKAKVPADMLDGDEDVNAADEIEASGGNVDQRTAPSTKRATDPQAPVSPPPRPPATGERRDFWADVMDGASTNRGTGSPGDEDSSYHRISETAPAPTMRTADANVAPAPHNRSFHARIAPLMDLFCYDDGDEFGRVPDMLPIVRLRMASRVWPAPQVQSLGFTDVRDAFERMRDRGLVCIQDDVAQLTLLGFRYHYPFHDPDGMLEVHLREARERVRALVEARKGWRRDNATDDEGSKGGEDMVAKEEEDEEDEASVYPSEDRLLPDVEFGI
ncbi:conserved hypothetical protein [Leishmania infantum JPCM5]|uniref:Uncharacterized protein n=2 Tax=Leishmania infantum TaxID=5671 RepID=A4I5Q8_LEIIN|nr:conserved hypothetical protein [Leishmania infantum JPCM5]CAC9514569.1 hypothetical_protein_-_conserved [Leishmania infantum]CAM70129.1 conserved hypothetical protein [Leishmania infantum JPCM5]SUZ44049.1 hypothetical_protein_-_conserved [Leishmania infantum]|eukprot:XP_001467077.1 conserved hypothetical protein [Leishmania infantum JPCM5]